MPEERRKQRFDACCLAIPSQAEVEGGRGTAPTSFADEALFDALERIDERLAEADASKFRAISTVPALILAVDDQLTLKMAEGNIVAASTAVARLINVGRWRLLQEFRSAAAITKAAVSECDPGPRNTASPTFPDLPFSSR